MQRLHGTLQRYTWGTVDAIPAILGREPDGTPVAEYWLGAHESSPSILPGIHNLPLSEHVAQRHEILGQKPLAAFGAQLPFLMKILSANQPLSIQAHPSREQAQEGWARENRENVPLHSPERTYRDAWPKPEIMIAVEEFHTLAGFRDPIETAEIFRGLGVADSLGSVIGPLTERKGPAALAEVFLDVLSLDGDRRLLVNEVAVAALQHRDDDGPVGEAARTVLELDEHFPSDPGILAALLMNRLVLRPGEALFVPAGEMHAHLRGTGIEVMANSDNVIRGGLTSKHIDVEELIRVVHFVPTVPEVITPRRTRPGVLKYLTPCSEFEVWRLDLSSQPEPIRIPGRGSARILLNIEGTATISHVGETLALNKGEAAFISAEDQDLQITGHGDVYGVSSGIR
ncbi:MAG: mannose-6-phosphate isomerase, class I [Micropruina sp.]|nr:mannose-6-phosphate isomerase, class I [Micropruina sp.]